ncbi:META domain-containing protein [Salipiger pacificus]|nr:META domain-containing protein [Alloyangia pacifica]MCA0947571.1 META domain-containing protein [Alloyangia pacifica]
MVFRWMVAALLLATGPVSAQDAADRLPVHVGLDCGGAALALVLEGDSGRLFYSGAEMPMARARSASGVKFDSVDDPETYIWTKGDEATVRIAGQDLDACKVNQVSRATEGPWRVALLDGEALDGKPVELVFGADGAVSGDIGCGDLAGDWSAGDDGTFRMEVTADGGESCSPEEAARQETLIAALRAVTGLGFTSVGALELRSGDVARVVARH